MKIALVVLFLICWTIVSVIIGIFSGYKMGHKDAYMEWLEKEDYYDWLINFKKEEELK